MVLLIQKVSGTNTSEEDDIFACFFFSELMLNCNEKKSKLRLMSHPCLLSLSMRTLRFLKELCLELIGLFSLSNHC